VQGGARVRGLGDHAVGLRHGVPPGRDAALRRGRPRGHGDPRRDPDVLELHEDRRHAPARAGHARHRARGLVAGPGRRPPAAGGSVQTIVKINSYVTDIRYRADFATIRQEVFAGRLPASTLVQVVALAHPDWMIEVEAIAVI